MRAVPAKFLQKSFAFYIIEIWAKSNLYVISA